MANRAPERPSAVVRHAHEPVRLKALSETMARNAARALWATALIYLIGSIADLVILWSVNADTANPMWEFTALDRTISGSPRIVLAIALAWTALYVAGGKSLVWYRVMSTVLIILGIAGGVAAAMMVSDYFVLRGSIPAQERAIFASIVVKTALLGGLFTLLLVPVGVLGLRRARA